MSRILLHGAAALSLLLGLCNPAAAVVECNRECLTGFLNTYLQALKNHNAAGLPVTKNIKYTENGVRLNLTDGLWQTVTDLPVYRINVVDEEAGSVGMLGIIFENGNRNFFATRLKVEKGRQVSEIENLIVRNVNPSGLGNAQRNDAHPLFAEIVPKQERLSRAELVTIGDSYFTGLDTDDNGNNVSFDPDCQRRENGTETANSTDPQARGMAKLGCKAQFDTGFSVIVTDIRERRFVAVDPDYGLSFAFGYFDHDGSVPAYKNLVTGEMVDVSPAFRQPFSFIIAEIFKIKQGRIRQIEAVLTTVPYGMPSGW